MTRRYGHNAILLGLLVVSGLLVGSSTAWGQRPAGRWYFHPNGLPPGSVGGLQLQRHKGMRGYYQPVEVMAPKGVDVSFAINGAFERPRSKPNAALLIGGVYRLRLRGIPGHPEASVYPTIELVNRLHPPAGQAWRHPVPIRLSKEDIEFAVQGRLVTRVVYVEDPRQAMPLEQRKGEQQMFDVNRTEDPLRAADRLGRPIAIVRLGSRTPSIDGATGRFLFESPPLLLPPTRPNSRAQAYRPTRIPSIPRTDIPRSNIGTAQRQRIRR